MLFPLALEGQIQAWYMTLQSKLIHNWKRSGEVFLVARDNYEVEILFCELDKFHRQHESTEDCI
jgi:hypothetical protein